MDPLTHFPRGRARFGRHLRLQLSRSGAAPSIRRSSAPTRCWRTTPSGSRRSRSTTPSTGCRPRSCWPAGRPGTPDDFTFTLKAPRRITHDAKLQRCEDLLQAFCRTAQTLGPKLGDAAVPAAAELQEGPDVLARSSSCCPRARAPRSSSATRRGSTPRCSTSLRARNLALCVADSEKMTHAGRSDRRLRLLPPARRGLSAGRHRALGGDDQALAGARGVRLLQARRAGPRAGVRAAVIDAPSIRR